MVSFPPTHAHATELLNLGQHCFVLIECTHSFSTLKLQCSGTKDNKENNFLASYGRLNLGPCIKQTIFTTQ